MAEIRYRNRRAHALENESLQVVVTVEGGHIAAIIDKASGVNPLWTPQWPSIEPSHYAAQGDTVYGANAESKLLSGIMGHNLCLDIFGGPSEEEAAAGMGVHGEASVAVYDITVAGDTLTQRAEFPVAQLGFERSIRLPAGGRTLHIRECIENLTASDRPVAWTQHVTLGAPFVERGKTVFRADATKSKVIEHDFTGGKGYMQIGAEFYWPNVPALDGSHVDLQVYTTRAVSGAFTTHLMDPAKERVGFSAHSPACGLTLSYEWRRSDFPWLGIWEENCSRTAPPWNGVEVTRGMEFGVSPFPETRRAMIDRGHLFGVPGFRWIPARTKVTLDYWAKLEP